MRGKPDADLRTHTTEHLLMDTEVQKPGGLATARATGRETRLTRPALARGGRAELTVSSGVHDKSEAFVLEAHELADSGGDEQAARNQMRLDLCNDLVDRLLI
jgi:hypothetical protein